MKNDVIEGEGEELENGKINDDEEHLKELMRKESILEVRLPEQNAINLLLTGFSYLEIPQNSFM